MIWDARNSQALQFAVHNHEWEVIDCHGLVVVRKPTTDEARQRRALQEFTDMTPAEVTKAMRTWMRKHHPHAAPRVTKTQRRNGPESMQMAPPNRYHS
jgi:hypothetical protein